MAARTCGTMSRIVEPLKFGTPYTFIHLMPQY
jgi:hypothetical protein